MDASAHKMPRLLRHFLTVSLGNYGALAASFLINIILTRRLGVELFGRLSLLLMVSQVLLLVVGNWTQIGLIRNASQEFVTEQTTARTFWARMAILGPLLGGSAIILAGAREPLAAYLEIPSWALALIFGHVLSALVLASVGAVLQARQAMTRYGAAMFIEKASNLALVALLPSSMLTDPLSVVLCYAASALLVALGAGMSLGWRTFLPVRFEAQVTRALWRFSIPFILTSWAGLFATSWLDLVLLKSWRSLSEVGLYALASQLTGVVQQVTITFSTLLLPHYSSLLAQGEENRIKTFVQRMLPYWFLTTSAAFSLALVVAGPLVPAVFGEAFAGSTVPLAVLMVASSALALYNAFDPLLSAYGATWVLARLCVLSVAVKVGMALLLIPRWGVMGAALSTVVTYAVSAMGAMVLAGRKTEVPVLQFTVFALPVVAVSLCLVMLPRWYAASAGLVSALIGLFVTAAMFRLFQREDLAQLRAVWSAAGRPGPGAPGA